MAVIGDKGKIQQIVFNLIDNAIKYSEGEWIKFHLAYDFAKESIAISVSDNGVGISSAIVDQLFLRFEQRHSQNEGVGLGLAIVEQLTTLMRGEISVDTEAGQGAAFTCTIPATIAAQTSVLNNDALAEMSVDTTHKETKFNLLVVDDNILNLKIVTTLLSQAGYHCVLAENGNEAKKLFDQRGIDLILTDMQLPDVVGHDLIKYFRQGDSNIPVVVYSAFAFDEDVAAAIAAGATDYLRKPATFTEMQTKLACYLK
jgi:CheY-like chemotaxis protein